jgi:hypothetical protein
MATPDVSAEFLDRLVTVEDAIQHFKFVHMIKTDATTNGLAMLHAQQRRLQEELSGFRGEVAAHLGSVDTRLESIEAEQSRQGEKLTAIEAALAEVLRRLPEQT